MFDKLEKILGPLATKLSSNKVLTAIRDGFLVGTPLIIVASIFLVIGNFPIPGYTDFVAKFLGKGWDGYLDAVIGSTFGIIALLGVIGIGYYYGKAKGIEGIAGAAVSLVAFLILSPQTHPLFVDKEGKAFSGFASGNLGTKGLFLAMITALISVTIFTAIKNKGWTIKLPDGVPPAVMNSFAALIPSMFVMFTFFIIRLVFLFLTKEGYAHDFIYKILQAPLMGFGQSLIFEPIYQFLSTLFWFFGINGPAVTNTIFNPIHLALTAENLTAFNAHQPLPNIFTGPFGDFFSNFGGGGSTLSLVLLMIFKGKSERMKKLGKLSIVPGIFGINEMVIFGLPVVLNPIIAIPFLLVPLVNTILATAATLLHIIPRTTGVLLPWTTPMFFSGWLATGSIIAGIFQIILVIIGCLIYYPFFKVLDNQYLEEETKPIEKNEKDDLEDISLDDISF